MEKNVKKLVEFRLRYNKDWHEIGIILLVIVYFLSCLFIFLFFFIDLVPLVKKEDEEEKTRLIQYKNIQINHVLSSLLNTVLTIF